MHALSNDERVTRVENDEQFEKSTADRKVGFFVYVPYLSTNVIFRLACTQEWNNIPGQVLFRLCTSQLIYIFVTPFIIFFFITLLSILIKHFQALQDWKFALIRSQDDVWSSSSFTSE